MRRRECIIVLGGAAITWPFNGRAQGSRPARIGFLGSDSLKNPDAKVAFDAFLQGLRDLGYIEGHSATIEYRGSEGNFRLLPDLANELVELHVDVILAPNSAAASAVKRATATIPIVVAAMGDPVSDGLVESLARPGTNVTGSTFLGPELIPKRLALLKEMLPRVSRIAMLVHSGAYPDRTMSGMVSEATQVADTLGVGFQIVQVRNRAEIAPAFDAITAEALFPFPSPMFYNARAHIVTLAEKHRLPAIFVDRSFVELGGLMSYGAGVIELFRTAAAYVDKILKGARPFELPVEQPTKFDLVINLRTAKALGLEVAPTLLARADEVIE